MQCDFRVETERFFLRTLIENDATEDYLSWLRDDMASKYISAASQAWDILKLRRFILEKLNSPGVLFFGIFVRDSGVHIGNIKFERIDRGDGCAELGVLIGDPYWRGKGVFGEIFLPLQNVLFEHYQVKNIHLGVSKENAAAIRSYEKSGFSQTDGVYFTANPPSNVIFMAAEIQVSDLRKQEL